MWLCSCVGCLGILSMRKVLIHHKDLVEGLGTGGGGGGGF